MFTCLVRRAPIHGVSYYIDGMDLLRLLQKVVNGKKSQDTIKKWAGNGDGAGTQKQPWRLKTADKWLGCAITLPSNTDNYLIVGGRLIKRGGNMYISDEGPAWRAGHEGALPLTGAGAAPAVGVVATVSKGPAPAELKAFQGVAPTYRAAAQQIVDPNKILPEATARRKEADLALAESWKDAAKQPLLVSAMRSLLKGERLALFVDGKVNKDYSRLQTALPVLVVAMFLAESARNARAFPVNLMLLDLAQRGVYTFDRIFWHPHALEVDKEQEKSPTWSGRLPIPGREVGPTSKEDRQVVDLQTRGQLHLVGGIMPASPTGGAECAKGEAMPGKPEGAKPKFTPDYIHSKEASVLLRWLQLETFSAWQARESAPNGDAKPLPYGSVVFSQQKPLGKKYDGADALGRELQNLESLVSKRIGSLDSMPAMP